MGIGKATDAEIKSEVNSRNCILILVGTGVSRLMVI